MLTRHRQQLLLDYIKAHKSAQAARLSDVFAISVSTVRRDLIALESQGLIQRVHGGAVIVEAQGELPLRQRAAHQAAEKHRIGEAAAALVEDGDTILISGGTTSEEMIPFLAARDHLTVITNSISCALRLARYERVAAVILGGWLRHSEYSVHGPLTEGGLRDLQPNKVFFSVFGISPQHGLTGANLQEVQTDRFLISAAENLIVLADHTKFSRTGPVRLAPLNVVTTLITDRGAAAQDLQAIREKGVQVIAV